MTMQHLLKTIKDSSAWSFLPVISTLSNHRLRNISGRKRCIPQLLKTILILYEERARGLLSYYMVQLLGLISKFLADVPQGAPGVGKTCTAETVADLVRKPLYSITCGDLGSTAKEIEENLKEHFTLASRWDCVMLLDEADVFLAKRKTEDLHRNSIVSVFLRIMEYYKGLLFLTTNRVGTFDEAFKSRVHISLFCKHAQGNHGFG